MIFGNQQERWIEQIKRDAFTLYEKGHVSKSYTRAQERARLRKASRGRGRCQKKV